MSVSQTAPVTGRRRAAAGSKPAPGLVRKILPPLVVAILAMVLIPEFFNSYWLFTMTAGIISITVMQSLGVITGRVGVMSLCQMSFAMIGAWVVGWCNVGGVPGGFYLWMLLGGLAAMPFGLIIGLPALRLRGVNLAIVTFAFASALDVIFSAQQFPGSQNFEKVARPAGFTSDASFFRFVVIVVVLLFIVLALIDRTRLGSSWLEVRYSERGAAAHGTSVARSKLAAFVASAFFAGIGGALMAANAGTLTATQFTAQGSLVLFAIAVVIGTRFWDAAVMAGLFGGIMPAVLDYFNVDSNYMSIAFGVLAVFFLAGGKGQLGQAEIMRARQQAKIARKLMAERASSHPATTEPRPLPPPKPLPTAAPIALDIRDVTVSFGAVTAVDHVSIEIPQASVVALIGPNGAGKSTLINAASGFTPYTGQIRVGGTSLDGKAPNKRAVAGLRRSFQQLRVPPTLTVGRFLELAAGRNLTADEVAEYLDWFDCPPATVSVGTMDVGSRRVLEVAGLAASKAAVLLLDEPAAGQSAHETEILTRGIVEIPERTGSTVVLVEHDIDVIRSACQSVIVMDFGKVIASGPADAVLADPAVVRAYIGGEVTESGEPAPVLAGQASDSGDD